MWFSKLLVRRPLIANAARQSLKLFLACRTSDTMSYPVIPFLMINSSTSVGFFVLWRISVPYGSHFCLFRQRSLGFVDNGLCSARKYVVVEKCPQDCLSVWQNVKIHNADSVLSWPDFLGKYARYCVRERFQVVRVSIDKNGVFVSRSVYNFFCYYLLCYSFISFMAQLCHWPLCFLYSSSQSFVCYQSWRLTDCFADIMW